MAYASPLLVLMSMAGLAMLVGCESAEQRSAPPAAQTDTPATPASEGSSEVERELAKLSPEDRQLAEAQKVCPVSEQPLGSMGAPIKITKDGKSLFICCEGCREDAEKNFAELAAKLLPANDAAAVP